jgi:hypothetical protein
MGPAGEEYLGITYAVTKNVWMAAKNFSNCFTRNFIQNIYHETTAVLICDGHISHIGVGLVEEARKENTVILKLPPNCRCSLFSNKIPIIWIFCISRWLAIPVNMDKWSSTVF